MIHISGSSNLENLEKFDTPDAPSKMWRIDKTFHRLIFKTEGA